MARKNASRIRGLSFHLDLLGYENVLPETHVCSMKHRQPIYCKSRTFCRCFPYGKICNPLPISETRYGNWIVNLVLKLALTSTLCFPLIASSADLTRGKALYENHCRHCHESWAHTRVKRKATSLTDLRKRVIGWNAHAGLDWGHEEVDDVLLYLNEKFYHFE